MDRQDVQTLGVDLELIRKLDATISDTRPIPAAGLFVEAFDADNYQTWAVKPEIGWIAVTPKGRLLIRNTGMIFDKYLRINQVQKMYSKVTNTGNVFKSHLSRWLN